MFDLTTPLTNSSCQTPRFDTDEQFSNYRPDPLRTLG